MRTDAAIHCILLKRTYCKQRLRRMHLQLHSKLPPPVYYVYIYLSLCTEVVLLIHIGAQDEFNEVRLNECRSNGFLTSHTEMLLTKIFKCTAQN